MSMISLQDQRRLNAMRIHLTDVTLTTHASTPRALLPTEDRR